MGQCLLALCFGFWRCLLVILSLLGFCPTFPTFLKLPKLSPSRWDTTDNHRHPRQGQYIGQHSPIIFYEFFLPESLVESKYCCNFAIEFRKRLDMSLILNRNRESSVIPSYVSTEMLCG